MTSFHFTTRNLLLVITYTIFFSLAEVLSQEGGEGGGVAPAPPPPVGPPPAGPPAPGPDPPGSSSTTRKWGESCNDTTQCDYFNNQDCKNGVCSCLKPEEMNYDATTESCLIKVGKKCRFQLDPDDNYLGYMPAQQNPGYEELNCVSNAWCNRLGVCACAKHFVETPNGTCFAKGAYENNCTTNEECRQDRFLSCINGRCGCNDTLTKYNIEKKQCVGKADQPCVGMMEACVANAECTSTGHPQSIAKYVKQGMPLRVRHHDKTCNCISGTVGDSSGECRVGLGGQCSEFSQCAEFFKCLEGECVCPFDNIQVAVVHTQQCISLVGGPCQEVDSGQSAWNAPKIAGDTSGASPPVGGENSTGGENQAESSAGQGGAAPGGNGTSSVLGPKVRNYQCIENSNCQPLNNDTSSGIYECTCDEGYIPNKDGTCDLAYGSKCRPGFSGNKKAGGRSGGAIMPRQPTAVCDRSSPLACINGMCQCESTLYEYDGKGACLGKHGAKCDISLKNHTEADGQKGMLSKQCIEGAECVAVRERSFPAGRCQCTSDPQKNRMCSGVNKRHGDGNNKE